MSENDAKTAQGDNEARPLVDRALDAVFGYDFFISYKWEDGSVYATALARALRALNYDVFQDTSGFAKGDDWRRVGGWTLRRTGQLILIGTRKALESGVAETPVEREVRVFATTGRRIIPINFVPTTPDGKPSLAESTVERARLTSRALSYLTPSMIAINEDADRVRKGPSPRTIADLQQTFQFVTQRKKRLRLLVAASAILLAATIASVWYGVSASVANEAAQRRLREQTEERGRQELLQGNWQLAAIFLQRAYDMGADSPSLHFMLNASLAPLTGVTGLLEGDSSRILCGAFSRDGSRFAAGSLDGNVMVWDVPTGRKVAVMPNGSGRLVDVLLSPDGTRAVSIAIESELDDIEGGFQFTRYARVQLWDVGRRVAIASWFEESVNPEDWSHERMDDSVDGRHFRFDTSDGPNPGRYTYVEYGAGAQMSTAPGVFRSRSALESRPEWQYAEYRLHEGTGKTLAEDFGGRKRASSVSDGRIAIWETNRFGADIAAARHDPIEQAALSLDNRTLTFLGPDATIVQRDMHSSKEVVHVAPAGSRVLELGPDGTRALIAVDRRSQLLDSATGQTLATFGEAAGARFSRNGRFAVLWTDHTESRIQIFAIRTDTGGLVGESTAAGHRFSRLEVAINDLGTEWIAEQSDQIQRWRVAEEAGEQLAPHSARPLVVDYLADGVVAGLESGAVAFGVGGPEVQAHVGEVTNMAITPEATSMVSVSTDGSTAVWDVANRVVLSRFKTHAGPASSARVTHDGKTLLTVGQDGTARLWDMAQQRELLRAYAWAREGTVGATLNPSGTLLVVWDVRSMIAIRLTTDRRAREAVHALTEKYIPVCLAADGQVGQWKSSRQSPNFRRCDAPTPR